MVGGIVPAVACSGNWHFQHTDTVSKLLAPQRGQVRRPARCAISVLLPYIKIKAQIEIECYQLTQFSMRVLFCPL